MMEDRGGAAPWRHSLGEILVARGALSRERLLEAVRLWLRAPHAQLIGELLVSGGFVAGDELQAALEEQRRRRGQGLEYLGLARVLAARAAADLERLNGKLDELAILARGGAES